MARSDNLTQVELVHREERVETRRMCWVDREVREGTRLSLKGDDKVWEVAHVFQTAPRSSIRTDWHNNI